MVGVGLGQTLGGVETQVNITGLGDASDDCNWSLEAPLQQLGRERLLLGLHMDAGGGGEELRGLQLGQFVTSLGSGNQFLVGKDGGGDWSVPRSNPLTLTDDLRRGHTGFYVVFRRLCLDRAEGTDPDLAVLHGDPLGPAGTPAIPRESDLQAAAAAAVLLARQGAGLEPLDRGRVALLLRRPSPLPGWDLCLDPHTISVLVLAGDQHKSETETLSN